MGGMITVETACEDANALARHQAADQVYGGHLLYNNDTGLSLPALAWPFLKKFQK